jgi:predicted Zn-dependent peptidase
MKYEPSLVKNELTGAEYYYVKHPSGLTIYVMEMEGYSTAHALFGTKYGSVNTTFKTKNEDDFVTVPEGIAHFLEHKLFENEDCDVFELYAKTGASGNAYTSFGKTVYLFSCTDNFRESLSILLDFVQKPYFTEETVAKEQGIIGQEIKMCEDNPYRAGYFNLLRALYSEHPIRIEVAGTVESIAKINADLLYRCYNTFYNLNNMVLCVAGNCKAADVFEIADKLLKPCEDVGLQSVFPEEPEGVSTHETRVKMAVGIPLFNMGFKTKPCTGEELLKKEYASAFLMDMIFGPTSRFYAENMESGLINSSFESETLDGDGYFCNILSGESRDPEKLRSAVLDEIERVKREGLSKQDFEDLKKAKYASAIRIFTSVQGCASLMLNAHMTDTKPFDAVEVLKTLTFEDAAGYIDELFAVENFAISIIEPL